MAGSSCRRAMAEARETEDTAVREKMLMKKLSTPEGRLRDKEAELISRYSAAKSYVAKVEAPPSRGVADARKIFEEIRKDHDEKSAALSLVQAKELHAVQSRRMEFESVLAHRSAVAQGLRDCEHQNWERTAEEAWRSLEKRKQAVHETSARLHIDQMRSAEVEGIQVASRLTEMGATYAAMSQQLFAMAQQAIGSEIKTIKETTK